ncbi:hypothetical protein ACKKBG_A25940 [Auxenochlorella protothecoides x Auxenochlorella symbiontica]
MMSSVITAGNRVACQPGSSGCRLPTQGRRSIRRHPRVAAQASDQPCKGWEDLPFVRPCVGVCLAGLLALGSTDPAAADSVQGGALDQFLAESSTSIKGIKAAPAPTTSPSPSFSLPTPTPKAPISAVKSTVSKTIAPIKEAGKKAAKTVSQAAPSPPSKPSAPFKFSGSINKGTQGDLPEGIALPTPKGASSGGGFPSLPSLPGLTSGQEKGKSEARADQGVASKLASKIQPLKGSRLQSGVEDAAGKAADAVKDAVPSLPTLQSRAKQAAPSLPSLQSKAKQALPSLPTLQSKAKEAVPSLPTLQSKAKDAVPSLSTLQSKAKQAVTSNTPSSGDGPFSFLSKKPQLPDAVKKAASETKAALPTLKSKASGAVNQVKDAAPSGAGPFDFLTAKPQLPKEAGKAADGVASAAKSLASKAADAGQKSTGQGSSFLDALTTKPQLPAQAQKAVEGVKAAAPKLPSAPQPGGGGGLGMLFTSKPKLQQRVQSGVAKTQAAAKPGWPPRLARWATPSPRPRCPACPTQGPRPRRCPTPAARRPAR